MAEVRVSAGVQDKNTCLATNVSASRISVTEVKVQIEASFLTVPLARGIVVQTECYVGTTGARFEMLAEEVPIRSMTEASSVETSYVVGNERGRTLGITPSFAKKAGADELSLDVGGMSGSANESQSVQFKGSESELAVTHVRDSHIRWTLRPHRARRAYADYLEGMLTLDASANWSGHKTATIAVTAQPTDIRFFGPDGARLGRVASLGLWAKLKASSAPVPSRRICRHDVILSKVEG